MSVIGSKKSLSVGGGMIVRDPLTMARAGAGHVPVNVRYRNVHSLGLSAVARDVACR